VLEGFVDNAYPVDTTIIRNRHVSKPGFKTAIPRRRYKLGEFSIVVLGEIESSDGIDYQYILAVVQGQDPEPGLYITAEKVAAPAGEYSMRIVMKDGAEVIDSSAEWGRLDPFVDEALGIVSKVLNLGDETPYRLM
jgi:hypothetical protein